jgi:SAM-dependent methyltransferase
MNDIAEMLCCPRCHGRLEISRDRPIACSTSTCDFSKTGFPSACGQPVLIDFEKSVFDPAAYRDGPGPLARVERSLRSRLALSVTSGQNPIAERLVNVFLSRVKAASEKPTILVIGGGVEGKGTRNLYSDEHIKLIGTDVYASPHTRLIADGHALPFVDGSFDGVWIQAVLEHVLEPRLVAEEIYRVLKPSGLIYAETSFLQQVHEGAYDFTRFTLGGHRWLFRRFEEIEAGVVHGAGTSLIWSLRWLWRSLGAGDPLSTLLALPFFWIRFLDRFGRGRSSEDAASDVYFFGRKSERSLHPREVVNYYESRLERERVLFPTAQVTLDRAERGALPQARRRPRKP